MSSYEVGELYVEIRPDTTNFGRDLKQQVERDVQAFTERMRARLGPKAFERAERTGVLAAAQRNFALAQETQYLTQMTAAQERANAAGERGAVGAIRMRAGYAALGIATVAVARGVDALGNAIKVTGTDAETTTGALRNMAAAASSLDVESFVKAGQIAFGRTVVPGGREADDARRAAEAREAEIQKAIALTKEYTQVQLALKGATGEVGTAEGAAKYELQQRLRVLRSALEQIPAQQRQLGFAQQALGDWASPNPNRAGRGGPTDQDFQLRVLRAQQTKATGDDLALQRDRAAFLRGLIARTEAQGATTQEAKSNLIRLYGLLDDAETSIAQMQEDNLRRRQERIAREIMLAEHAVSLQAANARTQGQEIAALQAQEALASQYARDKRLTEEQRLQYELQAANAAKSRWQLEQQIAAERARQAEEQKRLAEQERRENEEKLKRQREAAAQARELRLSNAEAKAGLTKRLSDDRKAVKASIDYWKEVVASTRGLEREQARSQLIAARGRLQGLRGSQGGGASSGDFFREVLSDFRAFGSNYASTAAGMLSPQQARGAFAGDVLTRASRKTLDTALAEERTRLGRQTLAEQKRTNALLARIAAGEGFKIDPKDYAGQKVPPRVQNDVIRIAGAILNGA